MAVQFCTPPVKSIPWPRRALLRGALGGDAVNTLWRETGDDVALNSSNDESDDARPREYRATEQTLTFEEWLS
jgi:hypothetical protein